MSRVRLSLKHRLIYEIAALGLAFQFHRNNSFLRKATTIILFVTWATATLLIMTGYAVQIWAYTMMTFIVAYILGRQHGAEFHRLVRL